MKRNKDTIRYATIWVLRAQDTVKNNLRKPWSCVLTLFSGNQTLSLRLWGNQRYNDKTPQNTLFIVAPNFMGAYAPLCPTHPVFFSAPPSHEPVAPMRRAQKNIGVLFFFGVEKKREKRGSFCRSEKVRRTTQFHLEHKVVRTFPFPPTQTNYLRVLCYLPKKQTLIEIDGDSQVYK